MDAGEVVTAALACVHFDHVGCLVEEDMGGGSYIWEELERLRPGSQPYPGGLATELGVVPS